MLLQRKRCHSYGTFWKSLLIGTIEYTIFLTVEILFCSMDIRGKSELDKSAVAIDVWYTRDNLVFLVCRVQQC